MANDFYNLNGKGLPIILGDPLCLSLPFSSQVAEVFLVPFGLDPPSDWTDYDSWVALIDNEAENGYRRLVGMGGVDEPDVYKTTLPRLRGQRASKRGYTLSLDTIHVNQGVYDTVKFFQNGAIDFRFWYVTVDGRIYGGEIGILPIFIDAVSPLEQDRSGVETATFTFNWTADVETDRTAAAVAPMIADNEESPRVWGESENAIWGEDENSIWSFETT
ncbi:MAG: hypothetical protein AAFO91_01295 [Bacteroidota bacterium]